MCNGKQMVAAEILGAQGMQMGTVFLATKECPIHENYRNAILKASSNNITVTGYSIGMPVRLIKMICQENTWLWREKVKIKWSLKNSL